MFSFTNRIKQFFSTKNDKQISQKNNKQQSRDSLRYSADTNTKEDDQDSLKYTEVDDNQTINYDWLEQKLEEQLSQILEEKQKKQYRSSLQTYRQTFKKIQSNKENRKNIFQKYKKGLSTKQSIQQSSSIQKQLDSLFDLNSRQSFTSRFLKQKVYNESQKSFSQQKQSQTLKQQKLSQTLKQQKQSQIILLNNKCDKQVCQTKQTIPQIPQNQPYMQKFNSLIIQQCPSQNNILEQLRFIDNNNLFQCQQESNKVQQANTFKQKNIYNIQIQKNFQPIQDERKTQAEIQVKKHQRQKLECVIRNEQHDINKQTFNIESKKPLLNFNYITKIQNNQIFTPQCLIQKPKVNFQYCTQNPFKIKQKQHLYHQNKQQIVENQTFSQKKRVPCIYLDSMIEQRIPIFLQRLRRINCYLPNLNVLIKQPQILLIELKNIIQNINSALTFLQLLFAKINYKIQALKKFKANFTQNSNKQETLQYFLNGDWILIQELTQIQYIKPKQIFQIRPFYKSNFNQAIKNFRQNCQHYKDYPLTLQTQNGKAKYLKIREIFFKIEINIKKMSQDLYGLWLMNCHFPYQYKIFFNFLKNNQKGCKLDQNTVLCYLIQLQQFNDCLVLSIVGKTIQNKNRLNIQKKLDLLQCSILKLKDFNKNIQYLFFNNQSTQTNKQLNHLLNLK